MSDDKLKEKDAVTVGQIRKRFNAVLDSQIDVLNGLIRAGYFKRNEAAKYLDETIGETLTKLQNIDVMAGTEVYFPLEKKP